MSSSIEDTCEKEALDCKELDWTASENADRSETIQHMQWYRTMARKSVNLDVCLPSLAFSINLY
jgi:hypothetical protein